ncbi:MAG TPA: nucleoside deaminase [Acidobacteriota bacterium]|nr:nucleoside deaminase [Acidobacteriota bacterium]
MLNVNDPAATLRDGAFVQRCYELAEAAVEAGNHPFGALLVHDDEVVFEAGNTVNTGNDGTRHAELQLVRGAWGALGPELLGKATLYTSTEPCLMCAGAIFWAGIPRVVYGVGARAMTAIVGKPYRGLPLREVELAAGFAFEVVGPVMQDDGLRIHADFWPAAGG